MQLLCTQEVQRCTQKMQMHFFVMQFYIHKPFASLISRFFICSFFFNSQTWQFCFWSPHFLPFHIAPIPVSHPSSRTFPHRFSLDETLATPWLALVDTLQLFSCFLSFMFHSFWRAGSSNIVIHDFSPVALSFGFFSSVFASRHLGRPVSLTSDVLNTKHSWISYYFHGGASLFVPRVPLSLSQSFLPRVILPCSHFPCWILQRPRNQGHWQPKSFLRRTV